MNDNSQLTDSQRQDLARLRSAAKERQWTDLQDTLKRLLANLEPLIALQVAAVQIEAFMPIFNDYYPQAGWVRELTMTVMAYASAPDELPEQAVNQFPSPGCGNYVIAVLDLARCVQDKYTVFERYSHIVNVVSNAILARLQHRYFADRPGEFTFIVDLEGDETKKAKIYQKFWRNPDVAQFDTQLWLAVADDVEAKLKQA